jgi:hypothetical protein
LARAGAEAALPRERRDVRSAALRALDAEIEVQRRELAIAERARDTLARRDQEAARRCDAATDRSPCSGAIGSVWCRACGFIARRCDAHGSRRAAAAVLRHHEHQEHGAGWSATADDEGGVPEGSEALPVGGLPPSPAAGRDEPGRPSAQRPLWGDTEGAHAEGE